ncbi:hypothetical protein [Nonomuraea sp. NPDC049625]|uniref:hypothetical protein n=1 Tax=Nonomuraea sp. NPDC049625 TaxID=3155775 RepID=UPI00343B4ABA
MRGVASSAPAVLIGHLADATRHLRVGAGGVLLPNHAPTPVLTTTLPPECWTAKHRAEWVGDEDHLAPTASSRSSSTSSSENSRAGVKSMITLPAPAATPGVAGADAPSDRDRPAGAPGIRRRSPSGPRRRR